MSVRVFWHPSSARYDPGPGTPESPARIHAVMAHLRSDEISNIVSLVEAPTASHEAITRVHPTEFLDNLQSLGELNGPPLEEDTLLDADSFAAALHAAGGAIEAVTSALNGQPAFAAFRPPGHHATRDVAMGFCLLSNVAIAAYHALEVEGLSRILVVDWDVHHGNGTQANVEADERVRFVSMHQWPLYPGTGREKERGVGNVFNVPLPPGLPRETYRSDLSAAVQAATDGWKPELVIISAGYDSLAQDPLGGFTLEPEDYAAWITEWRDLGAPIAVVLEGGYAPARMALGVGATVRALA